MWKLRHSIALAVLMPFAVAAGMALAIGIWLAVFVPLGAMGLL